MSFYITITKNKNGDISSHIKDSINLTKGLWRAALVETYFPCKFPQIVKNELICTTYTKHSSENIESVNHHANNNMFFNSYTKFINYLYRHFLKKHRIDISYVDQHVIIKSQMPRFFSVVFSEKIAYMLGVEPNLPLTESKSNIGDLNGGFYNLYLYANIITPQHIGNAKGSLLKTLAIDRSQEYKHNIIKNPQYMDVYHTQLTRINLIFRDLTGKIVQLPNGFVSFVLHFKQIT